MADARKIIGGAAAAAATTGLVAVAAKRIRDSRTIYHVRADGDDWTVGAEGAKRVSSRHETKSEAVDAARALVNFRRPSRLVIHKADGEVQREHEYEETEEE